jgi:hypothetical protein
MPDVNNRDQPADQSLPHIYVSRGWPVHPFDRAKRPLTHHGVDDATLDHAQIDRWRRQYPDALWAIASGRRSGVVGLDVDFRPEGNGRDTLEFDLEIGFLPATPISHTPRGYHVLFAWPGHDVPCSVGKLGRFLDIRGDGGSLIMPPGPGRRWDPHLPYTLPLAPLPVWVTSSIEDQHHAAPSAPVAPVGELSAYGENIIRSARKDILEAPSGQRHATLLRVAYSVAGYVDGCGLPASFALDELERAALAQPRNNPRPNDKAILKTVRESFTAGLRHQRKPRR